MRILDMGTGSGCIAIGIAKQLSNALVTAIDISQGALAVAKQNAKSLGTSIDFHQKDILSSDLQVGEGEQWDVIVSNPPYVRNMEKKQMHTNVLDHEPHQALFVSDDDPLVFYQAIVNYATNTLKPGGAVFFEINEYLPEETKILFDTDQFHSINLHKDRFDKFRFVSAIKN